MFISIGGKMRVDLWKLGVERVGDVVAKTTHFNLHYNVTTKYKPVFDHLLGLYGCRYAKEIRCIITNVARAINYRCVSIAVPRSRTTGAFADNPQSISHRKLIALIDTMEKDGWFDVYIGGYMGDKHLVSLCVIKDKLLNLYNGVDVRDAVDTHFVEIKDRDSKECKPTRGVKGVADVNKFLKEVNSILRETMIWHPEREYGVQQYKRVYTEDLKHGGRFYNTVGGVQVLSSDERKRLTINGQPVVELDFKAMHASLLYEQLWQDDPDSIEEFIATQMGGVYDPYGADLSYLNVDHNALEAYKEKYNKPSYDPLRNLNKHAFMVSINARNFKQAYVQVTQEVVNDYEKRMEGSEADCKFYGIVLGDRFPGNAVCKSIAEWNAPIHPAFFHDSGIKLQYVDSEIMANIMTKMLTLKQPILPEHDSVIVRWDMEEQAREYMREAYKAVVGSDRFCVIESK